MIPVGLDLASGPDRTARVMRLHWRKDYDRIPHGRPVLFKLRAADGTYFCDVVTIVPDGSQHDEWWPGARLVGWMEAPLCDESDLAYQWVSGGEETGPDITGETA